MALEWGPLSITAGKSGEGPFQLVEMIVHMYSASHPNPSYAWMPSQSQLDVALLACISALLFASHVTVDVKTTVLKKRVCLRVLNHLCSYILLA